MKRCFRPDLCLLLLILFTVTGRAESADKPAFVPTSYQLYYGSDPQVLKSLREQIRPGQVIVIELRGLKPPQLAEIIKAAHQRQAKVIAYLSIGELGHLEKENFEKYLKQSPHSHPFSEIAFDRNPRFQSSHIDVSYGEWRGFLMKRIKRMYARKIDGLFLDTVDTADLYLNRPEWSIPRRAKSVAAMIHLIRDIKRVAPKKFIMQNRGLNLIGRSVIVGETAQIVVLGLDLEHRHPGNPDGLLWESAFAHSGDWIEAREREMIRIQNNGFTSVFTLGYSDTSVSRETFFRKSEADGFIPAWASSTTKLHLELTQQPSAK
ncbi:hypothetical protein Pan153_40950 [Gimesia panareensis]|uniref:Glycoside-hydrolase family GH114 TIM-barrel domain-containing protein n=1 Tax=Gimesia panareensis TaxID=2527978 RepID=A0A518FSY8_9PLAN|nr:endo alpha-1,4 polygalactosaminidase [Gimesia panareensis]QDV19430.1 hypothetical protein Pan153_40950 [Gimesia panareensis]